jgi:hypothetical protein
VCGRVLDIRVLDKGGSQKSPSKTFEKEKLGWVKTKNKQKNLK